MNICCVCDRVITGESVRVGVGFSASGAKPDAYKHKDDDPECVLPRRVESRIARLYLRR
ncbi:hypothetical protein [Streptomyces sp. SYSU K217416]